MIGPVCPHCGDLARGCACPPEPYVGDLDAWFRLSHLADSAAHEAGQLRAEVARERADAEAWTAGYLAAAKDTDLAGVRLDRLAVHLYPADQFTRVAFGEGAECCRAARRLGEDVTTDAAAGVYGPQLATLCEVANEIDWLRRQLAAEREAYAHGLALAKADLHQEREANRPLRHEVKQARARVAVLEQAMVTLRDARQRANTLASSGTVAMIEAYEAEEAAILALLALLPDPSPGAGRVEP